ncbi:MAG: C4-type zinc ribbon domain-containing protein [Deinococcota bacterium]
MLDLLRRLQTFDLDIDVLEDEKGNTPETLTQARQKHHELEQHLQSVNEKHAVVRASVRENELELANLGSLKDAASKAAFEASSSKEASQYQNQELQFTTRLQELEEDTLPLMERLEALEVNVASLQEEVAALEPELAELEQQEQTRIQALADKQVGISGERNSLASEVKPSLLRQYDQIRGAKRGVAIVPIKLGQTCGGCSARLPTHIVQKAMKGQSNKILKCPNCGRMLYYDLGDSQPDT